MPISRLPNSLGTDSCCRIFALLTFQINQNSNALLNQRLLLEGNEPNNYSSFPKAIYILVA